jgi:hypothetical protein
MSQKCPTTTLGDENLKLSSRPAITILILQVIRAALFPYYLVHQVAITIGQDSSFFVTAVIMLPHTAL